MIPTLFGITLITFLVIQLAPGSPVESRMSVDQGIKSDQVTKQIVEQTKKLYGLDKPVHQRYFIWLRQIATLDFWKFLQGPPPGNRQDSRKTPYHPDIEHALNLSRLPDSHTDRGLVRRAAAEFPRNAQRLLFFFFSIRFRVSGWLWC